MQNENGAVPGESPARDCLYGCLFVVLVVGVMFCAYGVYLRHGWRSYEKSEENFHALRLGERTNQSTP